MMLYLRRFMLAASLSTSLTVSSHAQTFIEGCADVEEVSAEVIEIRTTAYSHSEADHLKYGRQNAIGGRLKFGQVRSAAADWSRYPLGTKFKIVGNEDTLYVVDDYGRALVGKDVIDLYKPTQRQMRQWGAREVAIEIVEWGSFEESLRILKPREHAASHVRRMVRQLQDKI